MAADKAKAKAGSAEDRDAFLSLSAELTGFGVFDLETTGCADEYLAVWRSKVPPPVRAGLAHTWTEIQAQARGNAKKIETLVGEAVFGNADFTGPAKSLVQMWLLGVWVNPQNAFDQMTVSPAAYRQGLVWAVAGTHPQGAKQPGFGTWADPPKLPRI